MNVIGGLVGSSLGTSTIASYLGSCCMNSALSCCLGLSWKCCCTTAVCTKSIATRVTYVILFLLASFASWIMSNWAHKILQFVPVLSECSYDVCYGSLAVYRITFGLFAFHLLLAIGLVGVSNGTDPRMVVQNGLWPLKFLFLLGFIVGSFFIPNSFFVYYGWVSVGGAVLFILIQLVLLLEFAHSWSENWTGKMDENADDEDRRKGNERKWFALLLVCTIGMYLVSIALVLIIFIAFSSGERCWLNSLFSAIVVVSSLIFSGLSVHPKIREHNPRSGLLQSSVITLYSTYLVWSAVMSEPSSFGCNPWGGNKAQTTVSIVLGSLMTIVAVCYSTVRAATQSKSIMGDHNENIKLLTPEEEEDKEKQEKTKTKSGEEKEKLQDEVEDEHERPTYSYFFFHIIFALAAMYVGQLLTNWHTISGTNDGIIVDYGEASVWVKVVTGWVAILLYVWTIIAPVIFPDRDWS